MNAVDFLQQGVAFLPSNEAGYGDVLLVLGKNGERETLHLSARSYLQQLVRLFGIDLTSIRERYGKSIGKKQMVPLPLALHWTMIPLQVRVPIGKQQAHGWVVRQAIERIHNGAEIQLTGGHTISVYHTATDLRRVLREALIVEMHYQLLHQTPSWVKENKDPYIFMG